MKHRREESQPEIKTHDVKPTGTVQPDRPVGRRIQTGVGKVLSGNVLYDSRLKRHYPFILYCCLLVLIYMGYVFTYQRTQRDEIEQRISLQRTRAKALLFSSERIEATRHSNVIEEIGRRGIPIKEWPVPPEVIRDEADR